MTAPRRDEQRTCWGLCVSVICLAGLVLAADEDLPFGPCYRECIAGAAPMECEFNFTEEIYNGLNSACGKCAEGVMEDCLNEQCVPLDGVEKTIYTINRRLPGPAIHVCAGDTLVVNLHVNLLGHGDSMHWHGLNQIATPYMDGVSMITQCPVMAGQTFRYRFTADLPGTFFYHPHNGIHKVNGAVGVLVARGPKTQEPSGALYDADLPDHSVFLMDWMHVDAEAVFPGLRKPAGQSPATVLINGIGNFRTANGSWTRTPLAEFRVRKGFRYRFRIINSGGLSCPIAFRVSNHKLTVIATDSIDVQPHTVDTLYTFSGERFDVVLTADQTEDSFWIHSYTGGVCANSPVDQVAVLRYTDYDDGGGTTPSDGDGLPASTRPSAEPRLLLPEGVVMNSPRCHEAPNQQCVTDLKGIYTPDNAQMLAAAEPDASAVLGVGFHSYSNEELYEPGTYKQFITFGSSLAGLISNVSFRVPSAPLLTQPGDSPTCAGCPDGEDFCICTHVVKVPLGSVFDIVLVDISDVHIGGGGPSHPMHVHGYSPLVLGMGSLANITSGRQREVYVRNNAHLLRTVATDKPVAKDVVMLPAAGYAVLRLKADNPGVWFLHCHFQYHMASGMEAAIQVGEPQDFVKPPKNFPTCGNFMPT